jgi:hypothetical protein
MIVMQQPSLVISSHDCDGSLYQMWRGIKARERASPSEIAAYILQANMDANRITGGPLKNIIFNAHGFTGKVAIGGFGNPGISADTLAAFAVLKPHNVGTVWFVACDVARTDSGRSMCQSFAKVAGTQVIASDESQEVTTSQGIGLAGRLVVSPPPTTALGGVIDDMEGTVYKFLANGRVIAGINPKRDVFTAE